VFIGTRPYLVMVMMVLAMMGHMKVTRRIMIILVVMSRIPFLSASSMSSLIASFNLDFVDCSKFMYDVTKS
jgi:hypothetical protein